MPAQKDIYKHIHTCYDAIALRLCIKIVHEYQDLMIRRCVAVMFDYWADMLTTLCARLEHVMSAHINSVRELDVLRACAHVADLRQPHFVVFCILLSLCMCTDCTSLRRADVGATMHRVDKHKTSGRYRCIDAHAGSATLPYACAGVQVLCACMSTEVHTLLQRIVMVLYASDNKRAIAAYLINNYDLVFSVYSVGGRCCRSHSRMFVQERVPDDSCEMAFVRELLTRHKHTYVDETLSPHFGALITMVTKAEPLIALAHFETLRRKYARRSCARTGENIILCR
jgi:hypothetical protein